MKAQVITFYLFNFPGQQKGALARMLTNTQLHSVLVRREDIMEMREVLKDSGADVWLLMNTTLNMSQQCALAAKRANFILSFIRQNTLPSTQLW